MNQSQKTILAIGVVLLIACVFFVPYEGFTKEKTYFLGSTDVKESKYSVGYFTLFSPPSKLSTIKAYLKSIDYKPSSYLLSRKEAIDKYAGELISSNDYEFNSSIDLVKFLIQIFLVLLIIIGLILMNSTSKKSSKIAIQSK